MYYLNTINFKRKVNINRDNIYINIYNIPLIYIKESAINSPHATILSKMYIHTFTCVCESQRCFSLFSPLNIYISLFRSLPAPFPCCRIPLSLPRREAIRAPEAPRRSSVCPAVCSVPACPSLVSYQAQDSVTVWADAPRVCPRPFVLLPMCCRVSRCPFRRLFRGFSCLLSSVRVCVLLPAVVWWQ